MDKKKKVAPWREGILSHHKRNKPKRGDYTRITDAVRKEVDRRSMEKWRSELPCCEVCGKTNFICKGHLQNASQMGSGSDPRNIFNVCGTHGTEGCHDYCDNHPAGRKFKEQYAVILKDYYDNGKGREHWSDNDEH